MIIACHLWKCDDDGRESGDSNLRVLVLLGSQIVHSFNDEVAEILMAEKNSSVPSWWNKSRSKTHSQKISSCELTRITHADNYSENAFKIFGAAASLQLMMLKADIDDKMSHSRVANLDASREDDPQVASETKLTLCYWETGTADRKWLY